MKMLNSVILNEEQSAALSHFEGPALVIAGPGSGKTLTITGRIHFLIHVCKVPPSQILVITYTKEAAASMQKRFLKENPGINGVIFGTFHAVFYSILKQECSLKTDCLLTLPEKKYYLSNVLDRYQIPTENTEELLVLISAKKNGKPDKCLKFPQPVSEDLFRNIFEEYTISTKQRGKIDFDDMLSLTLSLFREKKEILHKWQNRFSFILVDEFQDTNPVQYALLKKIAKPDNNLFVVGDDDQSIYGFRGAAPEILQLFMRDYPQAKVFYLSNNYRSSSKIVEFSKHIIKENRNRFPKHLQAVSSSPEGKIQIQGFLEQKDEYGYMLNRLKQIKSEKNLRYEEMAVIFRTNKEVQSFSQLLNNANIPVSVNGTKANRERLHYKEDVLSYMKMATGNIDRETLLTVLNRPDRGIGREFLLDEEINLQNTAELYRKFGERKAADGLKKLDRELHIMAGLSPYLGMRYLRMAVGYDKWVQKEESIQDAAKIMEGLTFLEEAARKCATLKDFIDFLEKECNRAHPAETNGIRLLTMHASKGLEFVYVCIPNVNEGVIPHRRMPDEDSVEEERRLFYVAVTRAKKILDILYIKGTKERPGFPSRFLKNVYSSEESSISSSNS